MEIIFAVSCCICYNPVKYVCRSGCFNDHMPWSYEGLFHGVGEDSGEGDLANLNQFLDQPGA